MPNFPSDLWSFTSLLGVPPIQSLSLVEAIRKRPSLYVKQFNEEGFRVRTIVGDAITSLTEKFDTVADLKVLPDELQICLRPKTPTTEIFTLKESVFSDRDTGGNYSIVTLNALSSSFKVTVYPDHADWLSYEYGNLCPMEIEPIQGFALEIFLKLDDKIFGAGDMPSREYFQILLDQGVIVSLS